MTARLLIIALDAADGGLLDRWSADGTMPHLAALQARGTARRLSAPVGITDDGIWATFQYCGGLGTHGRYSYLMPLPGGKFGMGVNAEADRVPFWRARDLEAFRVAVLDIPKCAQPQPMNGIHLADWLVHGRSFPGPLSYPPALAVDVVARFGPAPPSQCGYHQPLLSDGEITEIAGNLQTSLGMKRAAGLHYLSSEPWDFFAIGFKEVHCAAHGLWDLIDPAHAGYEVGRDERLGQPIRQLFKALDDAIGALVTAAGPTAEVLLFSTSDFEPNGTASHLMPDIITRMNGVRALRGLRKLLGVSTRPYAILPYSDNAAAIRILARPGSLRYRLLRTRLEARLGELKDVATGLPVVAGFSYPRTEETGERAAILPDVLVHYRPNAVPETVASRRLGRFSGETPRVRPGNHVAGGRIIAVGSGPVAAIGSIATFGDIGRAAIGILRGAPA